MVSTTLVSALSLSTLFATTSLALPSTSHCRCTISDDENVSPNRFQSDSPSDFPAIDTTDRCTGLGSELEALRDAEPGLYADFMSAQSVIVPSNHLDSPDEEGPEFTTVILSLAARNGFQNLGVVLPDADAERSQERIVCREELESFGAYEHNVITLLILQCIVGVAVIACIAEGVTVAYRWITQRSQETIPNKPALRLRGEERLLRAFYVEESLLSPGADKKLRVYNSPGWTPRSSLFNEKRTFEAYVDSDDDEMNRPVM